MDTKTAFDREAFEKAVAELTGANQGYIASKRAGSEYEYGSGLHAYWLVWKASRAAIEIELPKSGYYLGYESPEYTEVVDVIEVITSHGIRIKGKI